MRDADVQRHERVIGYSRLEENARTHEPPESKPKTLQNDSVVDPRFDAVSPADRVHVEVGLPSEEGAQTCAQVSHLANTSAQSHTHTHTRTRTHARTPAPPDQTTDIGRRLRHTARAFVRRLPMDPNGTAASHKSPQQGTPWTLTLQAFSSQARTASKIATKTCSESSPKSRCTGTCGAVLLGMGSKGAKATPGWGTAARATMTLVAAGVAMMG